MKAEKGMQVTIYNHSINGEKIKEGNATIVSIIKDDPERPSCMVDFGDDYGPVRRVVDLTSQGW